MRLRSTRVALGRFFTRLGSTYSQGTLRWTETGLNTRIGNWFEQTIDEQVTAEEASGTRGNWRTRTRFDEQATGEQATCEPATGEQTTGEQATGEQAIGALKRSFLTEVPMLVFAREVSFKSCLLHKPLFIVEVHSLYSKSSNLTVGTSNSARCVVQSEVWCRGD